MNKTIKTISLVAVAVLFVGIVITAIGFVTGGASAVMLEKTGFRVVNSMDENEIDVLDESYSGVKNILIDVDTFSSVVLKEGETFSVKGRNPRSNGGLISTLDGETLTVSDQRKGKFIIMNFGFLTRAIEFKETLEITYPKATALGRVEVKLDLGNIEIADLNAEKIILENSAGDVNIERSSGEIFKAQLDLGNITIKDVTYKSSTIDNDSGNITIKNIKSDAMYLVNSLGNISVDGTLLGKSEFDLDAGDITLNLNQQIGDTSYFITNEWGDITVNGDKRRGSVENRVNGSTSDIHIDSSLGNVSLKFN